MKLFKYVPAERVDILKNYEICCTPPERFKDPYELRSNFALSVSRTIVKKTATALVELELPRGLSSRQKKRHIKLQRRQLIGGLDVDAHKALEESASIAVQRDKGVLCFSSTLLDNLMWYHYADGHRGFVIEIDSEDEEFKKLGSLIKVDYRDSPPIYGLHDQPTLDIFRVKPLYLKYESEYRILRKLSECRRKSSKSGEDLYFCALPPTCIRAVHLGHRISPIVRDELINLLKETSIAMTNVVPAGANYTLKVQAFVTN